MTATDAAPTPTLIKSAPSAQVEAPGSEALTLPSRSMVERSTADSFKTKNSLPRNFHVKTKDRVFFITVDDGVYADPAALKVVRKYKIPVTVFLTSMNAKRHLSFFKKITQYGGTIENHTMTHKSLTSPGTNLNYEICRTQKIYKTLFGRMPIFLRPPYGNGGYSGGSLGNFPRLNQVASKCGIQRLIMWDVVVENGQWSYVHAPLRRGDIVLFHFMPNLSKELKGAILLGNSRGIKPAALTDYLAKPRTTNGR